MDYIPPLVMGNRLKQYNDVKNTLDKTGLDIGGYIRVSTNKDSQKTSIENQKKYISEWAQVNGYRIIDFYIDIKTGAYSYLRDEMNRLKNDITSGKIKGIVTKEISRTSRDIMDLIDLKRSLADKAAFFISIKEGYDSRTDDDEFLLIIHAGLAQKERKVTSSRVKITQLIKAREGKTNVPTPAFGYKLSEDKQHLVVDPDTAGTYELIVDKFLGGWGRLKICKYLNYIGIKTRRGKAWTTNAIFIILTNPVYLGVTMYNVTIRLRDSNGYAKRLVRPKEDWIVKENTHPPLITKEKFDRIQQIVQYRKEIDNKEWSSSKKYLLSGLLYCASCDSKLYGNKIPKKYSKTIHKKDLKEEDYYYYYFDKKLNRKCTHKISNYKMSIVETKVLERVKNFFQSDELLDQRIRNMQYLYDFKLEKEKKDHDLIQNKLYSIEAAIKKQQIAYESDSITLEEYGERLHELREQKKDFEKRLEFLNGKLERNDDIEENKDLMKSKVKQLIDNIENLDFDTKDEIIRKLIKKIIISEDYTLRFEFTFEDIN